MGMRLALGNLRRSGGGCRSGMADSSENPRLAGLRGLEGSLGTHREAQAARAPVRASLSASANPPVQHVASVDEDEADDLFLDETPPQPVRRRRFALPAFVRGRAARRILIASAT